jgi:hypothetical protein
MNKAQLAWRHNGMRGQVVYCKKILQGIVNSQSATFESKLLAKELILDIERLQTLMETRVDQLEEKDGV